jgi:tetratricopeptide (TPR) repeat protein
MLKAIRTAVVLSAVIAGPARAQVPADPRFAKGMAQVQDGYLEDGIATLAEVGRRLAISTDRGADLAQVYLWMGIAHAQVDAAPTAKFAFREALRLDGRVSLAQGWPPKVGRLFATVKEDYPAEGPGHAADLEARLREGIRVNPKDGKACGVLVSFLYQYGRAMFEEAIAGWERCAQLGAPDAGTHLLFASGYWDRAFHDPTFDDRLKERYADSGLAEVERALALKPESLDGLVYKGLFLRIKGLVAADAAKRPAYLAEATRLEKQAMGMKARLPENAGTFVRLAVEPGVPGRVVE